MKKTTLQFGIIGCGRIAQRHAEHIEKTGTLVAVCDTIKEKAFELGEKYGAASYVQLADLFLAHPDIDVIAICSPNGLHAEHAIQSLKAGFHVLCEKPMALNVQDCGEMINAAEKANRRLFIVKQNRFNPPVAAVKKIIEEGRLGKIYSVQLNCFWNRNDAYYKNSWKGTRLLDGGTLYTQFSHFIDLLYWLVGDVKTVHAFGNNYHHENIIEFEDAGTVCMKFYNGVIGTINYTVNCHEKNMEGSLTIFAEKGTVKIGGQYLNELEYQKIEGLEIKDLPPGNPPNNYGQYQGSMSNHDKVYQNLADVLTGNGVIATNGFEGLKTVEIIDKIYTAMQL
ncbi:Gfo/Idh/MocA family oxidoreductase [Pseudoflavitalea sp. X16]|uniref:Gfo/Idh/MocA family protein n=1 Tax=Paraflavitalea devenefica TaxID=2716334 RepID=UPI001421B1D0|nr:Gfo/Idh/MocA family oxidoreductase [Paraflavitalea devenefica]NII24088.1 Gfo/Idh/MocA family oxidoreductase [Paraflavitalea devenefica]